MSEATIQVAVTQQEYEVTMRLYDIFMGEPANASYDYQMSGSTLSMTKPLARFYVNYLPSLILVHSEELERFSRERNSAKLASKAEVVRVRASLLGKLLMALDQPETTDMPAQPA